MSAAMNSIIGAQSDSIGRGAGGSESGEESGTSESRALQGTGMVFGSISVEIVAPEAVSSHSSSIGKVGFELRVGRTLVRPPGHCSAAELDHARRDSAACLAVARIRQGSSPRGCQTCSLNFQI